METKVRYLVDTNIWLERLLDQDKSEVVSRFLNLISPEQIFASDFSIHSIGVILSRLKKLDILEKFVKDLFINGQIEQVALDPEDLLGVVANIEHFNLDFDDSHQLTVSQKYDFNIITFDKDFNAKGILKNTPEEIIEKFEKQ